MTVLAEHDDGYNNDESDNDEFDNDEVDNAKFDNDESEDPPMITGLLIIEEPSQPLPTDAVTIRWTYDATEDDIYTVELSPNNRLNTNPYSDSCNGRCESRSFFASDISEYPASRWRTIVSASRSELTVPAAKLTSIRPGATSDINLVVYQAYYNSYFGIYEIQSGCACISIDVFASTSTSASPVSTAQSASFASTPTLATAMATHTTTTADSELVSTPNPGDGEQERESTSQGLSNGAKAGIGVGVGAGVLAILALVLFYRFRRRAANGNATT
ncbi:hypothetical protein N7457_009398 [Penicillium paradoxum]|uniref:uncharacterized protein n=1 Tax=Penicillium paradoxum TaxID=176176 RepID=UPI00254726EB|nr:uncharacterized protein N7457_009398 [Penicillium paradoxum]KAJ5774502.1 hypothetical protein N7457_009398 [Penicillium paradoxum]